MFKKLLYTDEKHEKPLTHIPTQVRGVKTKTKTKRRELNIKVKDYKTTAYFKGHFFLFFVIYYASVGKCVRMCAHI